MGGVPNHVSSWGMLGFRLVDPKIRHLGGVGVFPDAVVSRPIQARTKCDCQERG